MQKTKRKRKIKNVILKGMAYFMAAVFLLSACALDSESWIPTIACVVSMIWLAVFAYANGLIFDPEYYD